MFQKFYQTRASLVIATLIIYGVATVFYMLLEIIAVLLPNVTVDSLTVIDTYEMINEDQN